MRTLVLGASGATGKKLVSQLLDLGNEVKVIVRPSGTIPGTWNKNEKITVINANIGKINPDEMAIHVKDCDAVASCLGHNLTFKGIYGKPRKLVTAFIKLLCASIEINKPAVPVKLVLMNTAGNRNRDLNEPISLGEKMIIGLLRLLLPPHPDHEGAADFLRINIGQNNSSIEWVVVRPDTLTNDEAVTEYRLRSSPTRSAIFDPGRTSRINAGHFMAKLITDRDLWREWKGKMPVIYNEE